MSGDPPPNAIWNDYYGWMTQAMTREPPFFECPDCGKDIADSLPHAADCPRGAKAMSREPDDFSIEKPDIECNLRALLFEREAEIERLKADKAGWEVEGFIDRLMRRDDSNSERLVLEAISHLRGFSRDCDAMREDNQELRVKVEQLKAENKWLYDQIAAQKRTAGAAALKP